MYETKGLQPHKKDNFARKWIERRIDFFTNRMYGPLLRLVGALLDVVKMPAMPLDVDVTPAGNFRGFDGGQFYVVEQGSITARYQDKTIYTMEKLDLEWC